jgi:hypothetical protein
MSYIISVDFDGTIVEHQFPLIGAPLPGALEWLKQFVDAGASLILNTMRSGAFLDEAVKYCADNGVTLWGVNENPSQRHWTTSPKVFAHVYIDDAAFGCSLSPRASSNRVSVDWNVVGPAVLKMIEHHNALAEVGQV